MAQKQQLVRRGARDLDLTLAVRNGDVIRARQGWYTTLPETDPRVQAVRVGGRLTGISAIIQLGGWVLGSHPLHVSVHDNAARLRTPRNRFVRFDHARPGRARVHWDDLDVAQRGTAMIVGLSDALYRVVLDESLETAVAALDWALHAGRLDRIDFERLILSLPAGLRDIADWVDGQCESLPESLSRTRVRLKGHRVESQRRLGELERIDLVIDDTASLEVDGDEFHRDRFEEDRRKDIDIAITGLHGLRPSARAVFHRWDSVYAAISVVLAERGISRPSEIQDYPRRGRRARRQQRAGRHPLGRNVLNFRNPHGGIPAGGGRWGRGEYSH